MKPANKISAATSKLLGKGSIPEIRLSKVFVDFGYDSHKQAPTNRPLIDEVTVTNISFFPFSFFTCFS